MSCNLDTKRAFNASNKELKQAIQDFEGMRLEDKGKLVQDTELNTVMLMNDLGLKVNDKDVDVVGTSGNNIDYQVNGRQRSVDFDRDKVVLAGKSTSSTQVKELYNDVDYITSSEDKFEEMALGIHNDPKKILDLAKDIDRLEPEKDGTHTNRLLNVLNRASNELYKALPEINVFLNKEASRNQGIVSISKEWNAAVIKIGVGPGKSYMSPLEVYTHEVLHTAVEFALSRKDAAGASVRNMVTTIRKEFLNNKDTLKLLTKEMGSEKDAINLMKYLAGIDSDGSVDGDRGLKEFVVYSQTNKPVINVIKKLNTGFKEQTEFNSFAEKVAYTFSKILNILREKITGIPKSNDYDRMVTLVDRLMQSNNNALEVKKQKLSGKLLSALSKVNETVVQKREGILSKYDKPYIAKGKEFEPGIHSVLYGVKLAGKSLISETARKQFSVYLATASGGLLDEKSTLQSTVQEMLESDDAAENASSLGQQRGNIDRLRNNEKAVAEQTMLEAFGGSLSDKQKRGLNVILDTDMNSILGDPDINVDKLLEDEKYLNTKIKEVTKELVDEGSLNKGDVAYFNEQIRVLVNYMLNGEQDIVLLKNAFSIANMVNDPNRAFKVKRSKEFVDKLDQLITIKAIQNINRSDRKLVSDLLQENEVGVVTFVEYVNYNSNFADSKLYGENKILNDKGYRTDNLDKNTDIKLATMDKRSILEKQGYTLIAQGIKKSSLDSSGEIGYFVSTLPTRTRWHTGAVAMYRSKRDKGVGIKQLHYVGGNTNAAIKAKKDIQNMKKAMLKKLADVRKGTFVINEKGKQNISPKFDNEGRLTDFVYDMNTEEKELYLGSDRNPVGTVGEVRGANWSDVSIPKHNNNVFDLIDKMQKSNVQLSLRGNSMVMGADGKRYLWVGAESADKDLKDLWRMLPKSVRDRFVHVEKDGKEVKGFFIRADLQHELTGYTEFALSDTRLIKKVATPEIRHAMKVAGLIWKAVVALYKGKILLRMPEVLSANVFSNFMFSLMYLKNPIKVFKYQMNGVKALSDYLALVKEQVKLETRHLAIKKELELASANDKPKMQKKLDMASIKMEQNKSDIANSEIAPLVDEGFYTHILEEMEVSENGNIVEDYFSNKLEKVPSVVRNGLDYIWLSDKNALVKFMQTSTQFSDFVARYAHYNLMIENGADPKKSIRQVRAMFINYNKPSSPLVEWANQIGLVMFTKYFTRIQKALIHLVKTNPSGFAAAMLGQSLTGVDVDDPTDANIFNKDLGNLMYNPIESAIGAATPGSYLFVKDLM